MKPPRYSYMCFKGILMRLIPVVVVVVAGVGHFQSCGLCQPAVSEGRRSLGHICLCILPWVTIIHLFTKNENIKSTLIHPNKYLFGTKYWQRVEFAILLKNNLLTWILETAVFTWKVAGAWCRGEKFVIIIRIATNTSTLLWSVFNLIYQDNPVSVSTAFQGILCWERIWKPLWLKVSERDYRKTKSLICGDFICSFEI